MTAMRGWIYWDVCRPWWRDDFGGSQFAIALDSRDGFGSVVAACAGLVGRDHRRAAVLAAGCMVASEGKSESCESAGVF